MDAFLRVAVVRDGAFESKFTTHPIVRAFFRMINVAETKFVSSAKGVRIQDESIYDEERLPVPDVHQLARLKILFAIHELNANVRGLTLYNQ